MHLGKLKIVSKMYPDALDGDSLPAPPTTENIALPAASPHNMVLILDVSGEIEVR